MGPCGTPACNLRGAGGRDMCSLESPFSLNAELLLHLLNLFLAGISHIFWFRDQDGGTNSFTSFKARRGRCGHLTKLLKKLEEIFA